MKETERDKVIYSLNIGDIQTVATAEIERELTMKEVARIEDAIAENIQWYDAIANAIQEKIKSEELV